MALRPLVGNDNVKHTLLSLHYFTGEIFYLKSSLDGARSTDGDPHRNLADSTNVFPILMLPIQ
jgi:hypothetical protein